MSATEKPQAWSLTGQHTGRTDLPRTCELAGFGAVARVEPELQEWDYGDYEGRTTAEICTRHPGWNVFVDGRPCGESVADIARRADRMAGALRALDGRVAVFSHGHFLCALAARWIGRRSGMSGTLS